MTISFEDKVNSNPGPSTGSESVNSNAGPSSGSALEVESIENIRPSSPRLDNPPTHPNQGIP